MRESLTVLAGLLILCLSIALAAPYFVDWNAQHGLIEERLSQALGEKVSIHGGLDLKLLPTPYLHLQNIELIDEAATARFTADDVFLAIAIPPLLRGEIAFIKADVQRPHLTLTQGADGALQAPQPHGFSGQASFESISLLDGKIEIDDPAQSRTMVLDHLDLNAEASSLAGPFKGDGTGVVAGEKTAFRFSTGTRDGNGLRLKLVIDKSKTHPHADFDGTLSLDQRRNGRVAASFAGNAGFSGLWHVAAPQGGVSVPWQLTGPLHIAARKASMETLDLRIGDEDHTMSSTGTAEFDFSAAPKASVNLHARQVDIDRLLGNDRQSPSAPSKTLEQSLEAFGGDAALTAFPLPLTLDASIETATLNGETLADLSGALVLNENQPLWLRFESNLPGRSHVHFDGRVERGSAMQYDGRIEANTSELGRFTAWLGGVLPYWANEARKLPFHAVEFNGDATVSRVGFSGHNISLRLDRSTLSGNVSYTAAVGSDPARLFVDLSSPSLDVDTVPKFETAAQLLQATDLSIRFNAHAIRVGGLRKGAVDTGEIRLKLTKKGNESQLQDLMLIGFGSANVTAKGAWTGQTGSIDAKLNVPRVGDVSDVLQHFMPSAWLDMFDQRSAALSPLQLDAHAEATARPGSPIVLSGLNISGTIDATRLNANLKSDPKLTTSGNAIATIDAPDAGMLLRQLGVQSLPLNGLGSGHIDIKAQDLFSQNAETAIQANLAGLNLDFHGHIEPLSNGGPASLAASGQLKLVSNDLSPLLQVTGMAFPDPSARFPADIAGDLDWRATRADFRNLRGSFSGTRLSGFLSYAMPENARRLNGALDLEKSSTAALLELALGVPQASKAGSIWSNQTFGQGLPDPPSASITLHAKTFDILPTVSGEDAALQLEIAPGIFTFRDFTVKTGGGTAAGTVTLRRDGATAAVAGHFTLDNYSFDIPSLRARTSAALDFAGGGQNAFALMSSLAGSGHASFSDLTIRRADPGAIGRVFSDVEHDRLSVDEAEIERALNREFDRGVWNSASKPFDLAVAAGVLRLTPTLGEEIETKPVTLNDFSLALDLRTGAIDERLGLALRTLPRDWQGPPPHLTVNFKGPLTNPVRTIDAASFVNTLAARAIAREAARIQAYEFDLHERAFFNQRLQSERRREADRQKAEEDARRAEAARKAAEEAARLEKLRKAEEARKRAEEPMRTNGASEAPSSDPQPSNAAQSPHSAPPADPSTFGRY